MHNTNTSPTAESPYMDGHFTGYASVFGVPDLGRDTVAPGAFAGTLARQGAGGVRML